MRISCICVQMTMCSGSRRSHILHSPLMGFLIVYILPSVFIWPENLSNFQPLRNDFGFVIAILVDTWTVMPMCDGLAGGCFIRLNDWLQRTLSIGRKRAEKKRRYRRRWFWWRKMEKAAFFRLMIDTQVARERSSVSRFLCARTSTTTVIGQSGCDANVCVSVC